MNFFKTLQNSVVTICLAAIAGFGGYYLGVRGYEVKRITDLKEIKIENKDHKLPESVDFSRFWDVWDKMNTEHVKRPLDNNKLLDGAIHGMVNAVGDPYTTYLNAEENKDAMGSLNGKYEGIGAQLGFDEKERLIIQSPLDESPSIRAGLQAGDIIAAIDDKPTVGLSLDEAVSKIRGPAGTEVKLTLVRVGQDKPFDVTLKRETIKVESVKWEDKSNGIVSIRLARFGEDTNEEWTKHIKEIIQKVPNLRGIALDLRNNPGGYLESSVYVASEFVKSGNVVTEDFLGGKKNDFPVNRKGDLVDKNIKIVVLVNEGSASAAEILAAALKEKINATIVGQRSFGKGSVQQPDEFKDGASLHVTVAKWLTPNGNWLDKHNSKFEDSVYNEKDQSGKEIIGGLKPDVVVEIKDEDIKAKKDPQMDKALELLK